MAESTAVEKRKLQELEAQKVKSRTAWDLLESLAPTIATVLPQHLNGKRMGMIAYTAMKKNPRLLECTRESLIGSIMTAAMLGLEPSGPLGHGALIPYWNSKAKEFECQFQPMYQGLLDLARRSGFIKDVQLRPVYEGDTYSYRFGLDPEIVHVPMDGPEADDPNRIVTHVYCVIRLIGGGVQWDQMSWAQGIAHGLRYSPSSVEGRGFKAGSVWDENPLPMIEKTILKKVLKLCPKSPELAAALQQDDGTEMGRKMTVSKVADGVFDVDFGSDPEGKETKEREKATLDPNSLKPSSEENRGHGEEKINEIPTDKSKAAETKAAEPKTKTLEQQRAEAKAAKSETKAPPVETKTQNVETKSEPSETIPAPAEETGDEIEDTIDPEAVMSEQEFALLEGERQERSIEPSTWIRWAKAHFNVRLTSELRHKHFAEAMKWTIAGGKEKA